MQVKKGTGFLGSDVSKGTCNFVLVNEKGKELEPNFQLDDNREGHQKLHKLIVEFIELHRLDKIVIGLESTGGYENNWYKKLRNKSQKLGVEVFRINPKLIYHETKSSGHRSTNDGVSALIIAGYLKKNYGDKSLSPKRLAAAKEEHVDKFSSMRNLHKYLQRLIGQSTRTKNALEKLLYSAMPELLSLKGDKYPNWFLELLIKYPNREAILSADNEEVISIPYLTQERANLIYSELENSIGDSADEYTSIAISEQARDILELKKKTTRLKKQLLDLAEKEKGLQQDIKIVTSIGGIAEDTAIGFLMELEHWERFEKAKNLAAFWGMNPTIKQSGDKTYYVGMSKDGSSSARAIMFTAAKNVIRHEPYFANLYHRQRNNGKAHYSAVGIVMTKLSRVLYGMLKSGKKFESSIDIANKEKEIFKNSKKNKQQQNSSSKGERRYQNKKSKAPVSMTQRVKRKQEQNVSS